MSTTTDNLGLVKAEDSDNAEAFIKTDLGANLDTLDGLFAHGAAASRPAAGVIGRFYLATDTDVLSYDDGAAWHTLGTLGDAQTITGLKTFTGGLDASGSASGAVKALDLTLTDESAPSAPGANKTVLYSVSGVLHSRSGASGADTQVGFTPSTLGPTFATGATTMTNRDQYYTGATLASALVNGGIYLVSGQVAFSATSGDGLAGRLYDLTNTTVIAEGFVLAGATGRPCIAFGPVLYSGFSGTPTLVIQGLDDTTTSQAITPTISFGSFTGTTNKATWIQAVRIR